MNEMIEKEAIIKSVKENNDRFIENLMNNLIFDDLFSKNKNDICESLISIVNDSCQDNLLNKSNYELSVLFKVKPNKISLLKENISFRFYDSSKRDSLFTEFLKNLAFEKQSKSTNAKYILEEGKDNKEKDTLILYLENPILRSELERRLKEATTKSFDHSFNREKLIISKEAFVTMLIKEMQEGKKSKDIQGLIATLKQLDNKNECAQIFEYLQGLSNNTAVKLTLESLKKFIMFVYNTKINRTYK